jgi:uncharacterized protein YecE (DUF72 family)
MGSRVRIGTAGWSNPPAERSERGFKQTHLSFYAARFSCVEINSSFYREHRPATYRRWRDETPPRFGFSVKMPRSITHESALHGCVAEVRRFYDGICALQPKLAVVLVQLPPSLEFDARTARNFFHCIPRFNETKVVCEPRHPSWFTDAADDLLKNADVSRVAADPVRSAAAEEPGGADKFTYFRWHGAPVKYYSSYPQIRLTAFARAVAGLGALDTWCIFDNTARHAAWDDALRFGAMVREDSRYAQ